MAGKKTKPAGKPKGDFAVGPKRMSGTERHDEDMIGAGQMAKLNKKYGKKGK